MKKALLVFVFLLITVSLNAQWQFVGGVTAAGTFPSVAVVNATTVYIAGGPNGVPKIYKSTNGGVQFTDVVTTGITLELYCIWAKDVNTIFVGDGGASGGAGGNAKVYMTTNGGTNWTNILSTGGTAGFINGIVFSRTNPNFGIAQSDPPTGTTGPYWVAVSTNAGANWTVTNPTSSGAASAQNSIMVIDPLFYGFGLNAAPVRIGLTTNGGTSWAYIPTTGAVSTAGFTSGFAFSSDKTYGLVAGSTTGNTISRSTNGGTTWASQTIPSTVTGGYCNIRWVPGTSVCYVVNSSTTASQCYKSTNNGSTWTTLTVPSGIVSITNFELVYTGGTVYAYAAAADGSVLKLVDVITGVENGSTNVASSYRLEQNYPNPFNPETTIDYYLPKASFVSLKVYDILGNNVATLVSENKVEGNHSTAFDASRLSSGVYTYVINAGGFTQSKRMMLVK